MTNERLEELRARGQRLLENAAFHTTALEMLECLNEIDRLREENKWTVSRYLEADTAEVIRGVGDVTIPDHMDPRRHPMRQACVAAILEADRLRAEVVEWQQSFALYDDCMKRGAEMWRVANPGNELVIPDGAKLICWLIEKLDRADGVVEALRQGLDCYTPKIVLDALAALEEADDAP